jgi:integrase
MPNDAHLILLFLEEQERLGKKSGTINHRRLELNAFLEGVGSFDVTPRRIQNWSDSRDLQVSTRRTYLWHYSEFYKWAIRHSYLEDNPAVRIIPPEERRPPQVLSFTIGDLERAIDATRGVVASGCRRGAIRSWIALAAFQGMRCREIADLTAEDIDLNRQIIHFRQESPLPRSEILHPLVVDALRAMHLPPLASLDHH